MKKHIILFVVSILCISTVRAQWFGFNRVSDVPNTVDYLMADILDKVQEAEVLVIATPTYFLTMNGMLKTMIDRFLPKWQELGGHDVYLIITGHDSKAGLKLVGDELTDIFQNLGNEIKGIIWGENVWQKGEVKTTKAMEEAYHAGLNI